MVSGFLYFFHPLSIFQREIGKYLVHKRLLLLDTANGFGVLCHNALVEQCLEPVELNIDSESDKSELAKVRPKRVATACVPSINWTDCSQWRDA